MTEPNAAVVTEPIAGIVASLPDRNVPRLIIRPVIAEDARAIAALSEQLGYTVSAEDVRERIARLCARSEGQAVFVACLVNLEASTLVGWIEVAITHHLQSPPFVLIGGLVVSEGSRSLGIGKRLCTEAETWTPGAGHPDVARDLAFHP